MILATWKMAERGEGPSEDYGYEFETGDSGGGFDRIRFKFPEKPPIELGKDEIDTSLELNRRHDGRPRIRIDVPWYGGGMSFGSVSNTTQLSKARAAVAWNTFTCTGEGGFMERMRPYDDHMITQVATGLFGVREETIQRVRIVEFKYAQGAKPGLGGHLLGDKNTEAVAKMRETVVGISLFSPFPFHSVYSIEDHMKHIDWVKHINRRALISTKVSTPNDVDMVAVGSYSAGTHIIHLDGGYGGTGAAPDIAKKNIAMPIEYAISKVHNFLVDEGARDQVTLVASGGIRNPYDVAKAIALGADGCVVGTAELVALGCVRCARCSTGRGCPRRIATTDKMLASKIDLEWGAQRIINMYNAWRNELVGILQRITHTDADLSNRSSNCSKESICRYPTGRAQKKEGAALSVSVVPSPFPENISTRLRSRCTTAETGKAAGSLRSGSSRNSSASAGKYWKTITCSMSPSWSRTSRMTWRAVSSHPISPSPPPGCSTRWTIGKRYRAWK
jgi:hypothetical protein